MSGTKTASPSIRTTAHEASDMQQMFQPPSSGTGVYTVLARRYRSRDFNELIGQESIARTLQNAIAQDRAGHAYLFCGTRGVGKTSMARIFAKAINLTDELVQKEEIGNAILRGDDLDVIEIDGASNRGVQEARDLIAGAGLSPARCPYKIYIIDEVHMLTKDAFNALLKTMEEPPAHVKFILCTTEPQKVPATIQSRCQRFNFRAIPTALIAKELRRILDAEGITAEDAVIMQVARLGNGSMRDALSLLDRLIAAGGNKLTSEQAQEILGVPDQAMLSRIIDSVIESDPKNALDAGAELINRGSTVEQALEQLSDYLRALMIVSACGAESDLLELSTEAIEAAARQAAHFDLAGIVHMIAICDAVARNARGSAAGRALFDAALVQLCLSDQLLDVTAVLRGDGTVSDGKSGGAAGAGSKKKVSERAAGVEIASSKNDSDMDRRQPKPSVSSAVEVKDHASPTTSSSNVSTITGEALWQRVRECAAASPRDQAKIQHLAYQEFDGRTLALLVNESGADIARFLVSQTDVVAELVQRAVGTFIKVRVVAPQVGTSPEGSGAAPGGASGTIGQRSARIEDAQRIPLVRRAAEIFDAVVVDVQDEPARESAGSR